MEKRVLLAFLLSFVVLYGYQALVRPERSAERPSPVAADRDRPSPDQRPAVRSPDDAPDAAQGGDPGGAAREEPVERSEETDSDAEDASGGEPTVAKIAAEDEETIVVETPAVRAAFSTRGAVLERWQLTRYHDDLGEPVDLIPQDLEIEDARPAFSLSVPDDAALTDRLNEALFRPSTRPGDEAALTLGPEETATLVFEYEDAAGLRAVKTFTIQEDRQPYVLGFEAVVTQDGAPVNVTLHSGLGIGEIMRGGSGGFLFVALHQPPEGIFSSDGDVTRLPVGKLDTQASYDGSFRYVGMDDQYFVGVAMPGEQPARVDYRVTRLPGTENGRSVVAYALQFADPPGPMTLFLGPKDFDVLAAVDRELVRTINFGIMAFIAVPLLHALKWVYTYVGNYGWSIVILTVMINLLIFPLRHKSVVSMRKLQTLQPQVKAIQERYKKLKVTDPARQKMNQELMGLYREKGVNPASGCLPMVLTFPVLFAFYALLSQAIELRGAPFMLWIQDLSVHDPYYVTPLLMGGSMILQQRMTPMAGMDPMQQKMMMFMPVMFTVFFLWMPSGLVVYWLLSNVWTIGQMYVTNKVIGPPQTQAVRAAAERKVKGPERKEKAPVARKRERMAGQ